MVKEKILFVLNPAAVKSSPLEIKTLAAKFAGETGAEFGMYETEEADDITARVREMLKEGYSMVAVSGGDGTVSKVGAALTGKDVPLAILPTGTANVFAQDIGIPGNIRRAIQLLFTGHLLRTVDMMRIGKRYYLLNVGVGLNALMIEGTDRKKKSALGLLGYIFTGIKKAFGYQPHRFSLIVDGERKEIHAAEVLVFNSSALGTAAIHLHNETLVDDGVLDLCILQSRNLFDYVKIFISIFLNRVKQNPRIHHFLVRKEVSIFPEKELKVQADGDVIGVTPVTVQVTPGVLKILVPLR